MSGKTWAWHPRNSKVGSIMENYVDVEDASRSGGRCCYSTRAAQVRRGCGREMGSMVWVTGPHTTPVRALHEPLTCQLS